MNDDRKFSHKDVTDTVNNALDLLYLQEEFDKTNLPGERISRDNTTRTTARVHSHHIQKADRIKSTSFVNSRELFFGHCIQFALNYPERLTKFIMKNEIKSTQEEVVTALSEEESNQSSEPPEESTDENTETKDSPPESESDSPNEDNNEPEHMQQPIPQEHHPYDEREHDSGMGEPNDWS